MTERLQFESFTRDDFESFAGAECFKNGGEPIIADIVVDSHEGQIIGCGNGVSVVFTTDEGTTRLFSCKWKNFLTSFDKRIEGKVNAERFLKAIFKKETTTAIMNCFGLTEIVGF